MFTTREIIYLTAVPAGVALVALVAAWRPWRRGVVLRGHWGGAVAAGAAFLTSYALLDGQVPAWPPAQARHWLFYLAAALTVLGLVDATLGAFVHVPNWLRGEVALAAAVLVVLFPFSSLLRADAWTAVVAVEWMVGMIVALHVVWVSAETLSRRLPRAAAPLVVFVFTSGVALVMMLSGSLVYGRIAGLMAVVSACASVVSLASPSFSMSRGAVTVIVPVTVAVIYLGYHLVDPGVGVANGALLLSSLLLPWLANLPPLRRRRPWVRVLVAVLLAALPVGAAVFRAREAFVRSQQEDRALQELYTLRAAR